MAKPPRSPLLGYNHNLTHLGRVFHIQTEDSGPISPRLFTHLFYEGTILVSRKHEYDANLPDDKVRGLMQDQHKTVMKDLMRARLDGVIVPFFAARGEDLLPVVQGAVPTAALSGTPGPVLVMPELALSGPGAATPEGARAALAADKAPAVEDARAADAADGAVPGPATGGGHRRTATRSFEPIGQRGPTPTPVVVRAPDGRRSPFVRSGSPAASRISSADGVVVQRNVVVGGGSNSSSRPARIRPPVPYVVTGGGHTERPPRPAQANAPSGHAAPPAAPAAPHQQAVPVVVPPATVITPSALAPLVAASLADSDASPPRSTSSLGAGLVEDKSLDEVILEYLSEDGDAG